MISKPKCILVFILSLSLYISCGKEKNIEGIVEDVFGNPLEAVTIRIDKSTFSTITDTLGSYSLDYVPGVFDLIYSKTGYTTRKISLTINHKSHFPAEKMILYQIPSEKGIFYIGKTELVKLGSVKIERIKSYKRGTFMISNYRYYCNTDSEPIKIPSGRASFTVRVPHIVFLTPLGEKNLIYEGNLNIFERRDIYNKFMEDKGLTIGEEKLLINTFDLKAGEYAFVEMIKTQSIGAIPNQSGCTYKFIVFDPSDTK